MQEDLSKYNGPGTTLHKAQSRLLEMLEEVDRICKMHNIPYWLDGGTTLGAVRHNGFIPWDDDIDIALLRKDYLKLIKILEKELPGRFKLQNRKTEKFFHMTFSRVVDTDSYLHYGDKIKEIRENIKYKGLFLDIFYIERGNLRTKKLIDLFYFYSFRIALLPFQGSKIIKFAAYLVWPFANVLVAAARFIAPVMPENNLIFGYGIPFKREFRKDEILPVKPILFEGKSVLGPNNLDAYLKRYFGNYMEIPSEENRLNHAEGIEVYNNK
jgi:lipopolysaccharide cholinephosphotransferase